MWIDKENDQDPYNRQSPEQQPNNQNIGSGSGGGAPAGSGQGNQTNPTPAGLSPTAPTPQPKQATVQDYLGANKDQGNQLGQQFQSKLQDAGTTDKSAIDSSANNVTKQAQDATTSFDPTVVNKAYNDPASVAKDPNQLNSFLNQWNASYTGPANFEGTNDYDAANKAATDAQTKATETADAGGRKQLLQDSFGVYGQGNKGLDQTLLQNSDNFGQVLDTGKGLAALPDYLSSKAADVDTATKKAADTTAATKANTQGLFANSLSNFQTGLQNEVTADTQQATATSNQVKSDLATGDVNKISADLGKSNLSPADRASIQSYLTNLNQNYRVKPDLNNYYTYNPATAVDPATAATQADYAKAAALQKLTGVDYSGVLDPTKVSEAGTWNQNQAGFNGPSLQTYLKGSLGQQDKELLSKTDLNDVASKLQMPSIVDPKNFSNVGLGNKAAQSLISIAQRNNMKSGANGVPNNLDKLATQAHQALTQYANANGGRINHNDPAIAGLLAFNNQLDTYLYGQPQY